MHQCEARATLTEWTDESVFTAAQSHKVKLKINALF